MATKAIIQSIGSLSSTYRYGVDAYDSTKLGIGKLIYKQTGTGESAYAGPLQIAVARPAEQAGAFTTAYPFAIQWQNNLNGEIDWVFLADVANAAATRRINAYIFNRRTSVWTWKGSVLVTFSTATNFTIRGFRMTYDLETTGTVAVSGTTVTGTSTLFSTNKVCVGNRIGFGSTDPTQISTWYYISAIGSDTSITLTSTAGTISSGTAYVIEDLRAVIAATNATATNGGLFVCKGLSIDLFSNIGGAVPAATTVDNIQACYWLADASTVTNTVALGLAVAAKTSPTSQFAYVSDTVANLVIYKYNIRGALTLTAGKDTTTLVLKTGSGGAVTGTTSQANNLTLATASHGTYSGVEALYFTTTTRVYAVATSAITNGSVTWFSTGAAMTEVPPGGVNTFAASGAMNSIEYLANIDKFVIATTNTTSPFRSYVTQFRTDNGQLDRVWGINTLQIDQVNADSTTAPLPTTTGANYSVFCLNGLVYIAIIGTTAITNRVYAAPLGADWEYTSSSQSVLVFPTVSVSDVSKFTGIFGSEVQVLGGKTGNNLGISPEPFRLSYRTSAGTAGTAGLTNDTAPWTIVDGTGIISSAPTSASTIIQLKAEFRTIGTMMIPSRLCAAVIAYEDLDTERHYRLSVSKSDITSKRFTYRFVTAFGTTVPALRIKLYDAVTDVLYVDDNTNSPVGTFERSTNGTVFTAWNNTDKTNETTYLRYTPASLVDNVNIRPLLMLL